MKEDKETNREIYYNHEAEKRYFNVRGKKSQRTENLEEGVIWWTPCALMLSSAIHDEGWG